MDYEEASNLLIMCSSFDRFQTFLKIKDELNDIDYWRILEHTFTCFVLFFLLSCSTKEGKISRHVEEAYKKYQRMSVIPES